jgi:hypothetical protein
MQLLHSAAALGWLSLIKRRSKERFRIRKRYLSIMLSYLSAELLRMIHARPPVSVAVSRDRYSVRYLPPGSRPD